MRKEEATKELTICRHIPSYQQYVPADYIIVRESFSSKVQWREAFEELMKQVEEMVISWPMKKDGNAEPNDSPAALDARQLDSLPWKPYKEGRFDGWIFSNTKGAELLLQRLEREKVVVDGVSYRLSGPEQKPDMFIRRSKENDGRHPVGATAIVKPRG